MRVAEHPTPILNPPPVPAPDDGRCAWHYEGGKRPPRVPVLALAIAAGAHVLALFGFNEKRAVEEVRLEDETPYIMIEMPELEDLEEPELVESDNGPQEEVEAASYVPMLADVPSATIDTAFVQKIDYSSLVPRPNLDTAKVVTIPTGARTGGVQPDQLKDIFNLKDLDRVPEPVFQPPPVFPRTLKNEVSKATVTVEFIVGADGKVTWAKVVDTTYPGFEDAAVVGVMRWQFRPGIKNGKRVSTRMLVPLVFKVVED